MIARKLGQRGRLLYNKEECSMWISSKASFNGVVFWQSWVAYKLQKRTSLFCFRSFIFTWPVVTKHLFFLFLFFCVFFVCVCVFFFLCVCFLFFYFSFVLSLSAKTTVQWYFIVGPLLAVTVLAFVVLYLWKRRIAGTCALNFASFLGPYQDNKMRSRELKMNFGCNMKTKKNKKIYEYWQ